METVERLVVLSNLFRMCETIEELEQCRNDVRAEVKSLSRDCQQWLLDEWNSAKRLLELPGIPVETLKRIEKDENKRNSKKSKRKPSLDTGRHRKTKTRYADFGINWK